MLVCFEPVILRSSGWLEVHHAFASEGWDFRPAPPNLAAVTIYFHFLGCVLGEGQRKAEKIYLLETIVNKLQGKLSSGFPWLQSPHALSLTHLPPQHSWKSSLMKCISHL